MPTVLIIDDQGTSRMIMEELVRSVDTTLHVQSFASAVDALKWAKGDPPDLVLTDYKMPTMDGAEFIQWLRKIPRCSDIPVIVITGVDDKAVRYRALELGATDFLTKPIDHHECRARVRNLLRLRAQQSIIKDRARWLERRVSEAVEEILVRERETLFRLARAGEYRDMGTGYHVYRMGAYARLMAEELDLGSDECDLVECAAPMHDIGKIGVPDRILNRRGTLHGEDWELMKRHALIGYEILKDSPSEYLKNGATVALRHHERYDGGGYPDGLCAEAIPRIARIAAVADVFDALVTERPYKQAWTIESALHHLRSERGRHFDPCCVDAFFSRLDDVRRIHGEYSDIAMSAAGD